MIVLSNKVSLFLGKRTNFLKFLTSCLAKGDYAPSFPTEKFGQNGENYSPLHYLNHNRYYRGGCCAPLFFTTQPY